MSLKDLSDSLGGKQEESKKDNKSFDTHAQIKTIPAYKLMAVQFPDTFVDDINKNGLGIVEGADYVGVTTYTEARKAEYPPLEEQLDKIYHSGVNAWKADIKAIKDKYPKTQIGITSIAPLPDWVVGLST